MAVKLLLLVLCAAVSAEVIPRGYRLDLYPYPGDGVFKGRVRIDLVFPGKGEAPKQIHLRADPSLNVVDREVTITRLADTDSSEEDEAEGEQVTLSVTKIERQNQTYAVHLSQPLQRDATYQLDMQFDGNLGEDPSHAFFQGSYIDQTSGEKSFQSYAVPFYPQRDPKEVEALRRLVLIKQLTEMHSKCVRWIGAILYCRPTNPSPPPLSG